MQARRLKFTNYSETHCTWQQHIKPESSSLNSNLSGCCSSFFLFLNTVSFLSIRSLLLGKKFIEIIWVLHYSGVKQKGKQKMPDDLKKNIHTEMGNHDLEANSHRCTPSENGWNVALLHDGTYFRYWICVHFKYYRYFIQKGKDVITWLNIMTENIFSLDLERKNVWKSKMTGCNPCNPV